MIGALLYLITLIIRIILKLVFKLRLFIPITIYYGFTKLGVVGNVRVYTVILATVLSIAWAAASGVGKFLEGGRQ